MTQIVDSIAGTTTLGYDNFDRLTSTSSPQGSISYIYDAIGRRQTMTVAGQTQVTYSYDTGNRVTQIAQGSSLVQIGYDANGRRTSMTLPNGVVANYGYDAASQLTGITYMQGGSVLGNLAYTYDSAGRRATESGSLAHTTIPQPLTTASYNSENQLTQFGASQFTYDADGNLTSDGAHTYTWDGRNHLVAIDGGSTASITYDPFGRRISKTVYGSTTGYLYNAANVVQELSGGSPSANLLSGGPDEVFTRTDSNGSASFLLDGQGSTAALTDSTGSILEQYSYDSYGNTSTTGNPSSNSYQYIGREADATGLYYFRNRYYSPTAQRFISEDPARLTGGPNLFEYAGSNPTTYRDPNGKFVIGCLLGTLTYDFEQIGLDLSGRKSDNGWKFVQGLGKSCAAGFFGEVVGGAALGALADGLEGLGPVAIETEEEAAAEEGTPSTYDALQQHLDNAVAQADAAGLTPNQAAAAAQNPNLAPAFQGNNIDSFFKDAVT